MRLEKHAEQLEIRRQARARRARSRAIAAGCMLALVVPLYIGAKVVDSGLLGGSVFKVVVLLGACVAVLGMLTTGTNMALRSMQERGEIAHNKVKVLNARHEPALIALGVVMGAATLSPVPAVALIPAGCAVMVWVMALPLLMEPKPQDKGGRPEPDRPTNDET